MRFVRRSLALASLLAVTAASVPDARACTTFSSRGAAGTLVAKNFDWPTGAGYIVLGERGRAHAKLVPGGPSDVASWTSRFASVSFTTVGPGFPNQRDERDGAHDRSAGRRLGPAHGHPRRGAAHRARLVEDGLDRSTRSPTSPSSPRGTASRSSRCRSTSSPAIGAARAPSSSRAARPPAYARLGFDVKALANDPYRADVSAGAGARGSAARFATVAHGVQGGRARDVAGAFRLLDEARIPGLTKWQMVWDIASATVHFRDRPGAPVAAVHVDWSGVKCEGAPRVRAIGEAPARARCAVVGRGRDGRPRARPRSAPRALGPRAAPRLGRGGVDARDALRVDSPGRGADRVLASRSVDVARELTVALVVGLPGTAFVLATNATASSSFILLHVALLVVLTPLAVVTFDAVVPRVRRADAAAFGPVLRDVAVRLAGLALATVAMVLAIGAMTGIGARQVVGAPLVVALVPVFLMYVLVATAGAWTRLREHALRAAAHEAHARQAALAARVRPHFLFNALNGIEELTDTDPTAARDAIGRLARLLRAVLEASAEPRARLADEARLVGDYLAIERLRFGERMTTTSSSTPTPRRPRSRPRCCSRSSRTP